jgi:hypothetical protein
LHFGGGTEKKFRKPDLSELVKGAINFKGRLIKSKHSNIFENNLKIFDLWLPN